jgi:hypothetical protein
MWERFESFVTSRAKVPGGEEVIYRFPNEYGAIVYRSDTDTDYSVDLLAFNGQQIVQQLHAVPWLDRMSEADAAAVVKRIADRPRRQESVAIADVHEVFDMLMHIPDVRFLKRFSEHVRDVKFFSTHIEFVFTIAADQAAIVCWMPPNPWGNVPTEAYTFDVVAVRDDGDTYKILGVDEDLSAPSTIEYTDVIARMTSLLDARDA